MVAGWGVEHGGAQRFGIRRRLNELADYRARELSGMFSAEAKQKRKEIKDRLKNVIEKEKFVYEKEELKKEIEKLISEGYNPRVIVAVLEELGIDNPDELLLLNATC